MKKKILAIMLTTTLMLSACGGAAKSESNVAHNHATHTEVTTEAKTEVTTEFATGEVVVSTTDITEVETETDTTEIIVATKENEKSDKNDKTDKTNTPDKDASNNNSNNTGNTNTGSANNGVGNESNDSGANKPVDTEKPESTEKDTEKPADTEKDTEKPVPDTEKPVEDVVCKHTNTCYGGGGETHDIICRDCLLERDEIVILGTEPCNYAGGSCKCGTSCPHKDTTEVVESTDKSGRCGFTCNQCGWTSLLQHEIYWATDHHACGRCSTTWPCEHGGGANLVLVRGFEEHEYHCTSCRSLVSSEPHTYVNGSCSVCGWADPNWNPEPPVEGGGAGEEIPVEPIEDGVTSIDVVKVWKHICRHR